MSSGFVPQSAAMICGVGQDLILCTSGSFIGVLTTCCRCGRQVPTVQIGSSSSLARCRFSSSGVQSGGAVSGSAPLSRFHASAITRNAEASGRSVPRAASAIATNADRLCPRANAHPGQHVPEFLFQRDTGAVSRDRKAAFDQPAQTFPPSWNLSTRRLSTLNFLTVAEQHRQQREGRLRVFRARHGLSQGSPVHLWQDRRVREGLTDQPGTDRSC